MSIRDFFLTDPRHLTSSTVCQYIATNFQLHLLQNNKLSEVKKALCRFDLSLSQFTETRQTHLVELVRKLYHGAVFALMHVNAQTAKL